MTIAIRRARPDDAAAFARMMGDPQLPLPSEDVPQAQRQGVGSALLQAVCDYADRWAQVLRIELTVYVDNDAAIALYRKFGFETEGRHRAYAMRDGRFVDAYAMARLDPSPPSIDASPAQHPLP